MRRFFCTTILTAVFISVVVAQNVQQSKAYKFAEFSSVSRSNLAFIMTPFLSVLRNEDARGYIINYGNPKAIKARKQLFLNVDWRDEHDGPRITFVDVPTEKNIRTVMWIIPPGAEAPKP